MRKREADFGDARSVVDFEDLSRSIAIAISKLVVRLSRERDLSSMVACGAVLGQALADWLRTAAESLERGDQAPVHGPVGHG